MSRFSLILPTSLKNKSHKATTPITLRKQTVLGSCRAALPSASTSAITSALYIAEWVSQLLLSNWQVIETYLER